MAKLFEFWVTSYNRGGWPWKTFAMQNLLWVINLIYSAHNGRGVGLPYYRPFMAKLHYIEFWVTSYNRGGWPLKQFFLKTFAMESANLLWVINLIYSAHNGRGVGLPYCRPFMAKLHYIEFWVTSYNRGGWPVKQFFLKTFAMESKTFYG